MRGSFEPGNTPKSSNNRDKCSKNNPLQFERLEPRFLLSAGYVAAAEYNDLSMPATENIVQPRTARMPKLDSGLDIFASLRTERLSLSF